MTLELPLRQSERELMQIASFFCNNCIFFGTFGTILMNDELYEMFVTTLYYD
jgi:hypothetical protein